MSPSRQRDVVRARFRVPAGEAAEIACAEAWAAGALGVVEEDAEPDIVLIVYAATEHSAAVAAAIGPHATGAGDDGAWEPERSTFDVRAVAERVWRELEARARDKGVQFLVSGDGTVTGDESAIYQIFQNLFDNAIRYVDAEDGEIQVEIAPRPGFVEVGVLDNGAGIPASALPRVFERFYRVDAARSRDEGGTGLGLSIVRHLVTTMGGEVWDSTDFGSWRNRTDVLLEALFPRDRALGSNSLARWQTGS